MDEQTPLPGSESIPPSGPPPFQPPPPRPPVPPVIAAVPGQGWNPAPAPKGGTGWKIFSFILLALLAVWGIGHFLLRGVASVGVRSRGAASAERSLEEVVIEHTNTDAKIAVVEVNGVITGGAVDGTGMGFVSYMKEQFKTAEDDSDVRAVILKVDSPGGEVLASDEVYNIIRGFEDRSSKPVIVSMGSLAASGGYYISAPCRWIVANDLTITGSIGVIMHNYNYRVLFDKIGVRPEVIKSGRYKDMLSGEAEPDADKLTPQEAKDRDDERKMVQALIDETFGKFKSVVKSGREWAAQKNGGEGRSLAPDWTNYADGRILSGKGALDLGFVDELGDFDTAVKRAKTIAHISSASLVEYRLPVDFGSIISRVLGKTETPALKVDLGLELPKLQAGLLYFIAPTVVPH